MVITRIQECRDTQNNLVHGLVIFDQSVSWKQSGTTSFREPPNDVVHRYIAPISVNKGYRFCILHR